RTEPSPRSTMTYRYAFRGDGLPVFRPVDLESRRRLSTISRLENEGGPLHRACGMMRCMRSTLRLIARAACMIPMLAAVAPPEVLINGRRTVVVESPAATLLIDLGGGSIVDFHLSGGGLNPLHWLGPGDENAALRP